MEGKVRISQKRLGKYCKLSLMYVILSLVRLSLVSQGQDFL
jgi:hypothetical protein